MFGIGLQGRAAKAAVGQRSLEEKSCMGQAAAIQCQIKSQMHCKVAMQEMMDSVSANARHADETLAIIEAFEDWNNAPHR